MKTDFFLKGFFFLLLLFMISCGKSFHDKSLDIDNAGRNLQISIVLPEKALHTFDSVVQLKIQAEDRLNRIKKVEYGLNGGRYDSLALSEGYYEGQMNVFEEKNILCVRMTTDVGGKKEICQDLFKTLLKQEPYFSPYGFKSASCIYHNLKIYCFGGEGSETKMGVYDLSSSSWEEVSSINGSDSRKFTAAAVSGDKIYLTGGLNAFDDLPVNDLVYDTQTKTWSSIAPLLRVAASMVCIGGKIYAAGGGLGYPGIGVSFFNTVMVYDPANPGLGWQTHVKSMNHARAGALVFSDGRYIWAAGGYNDSGKVLDSLEVFDTQNQDAGWIMLAPMSKPRFLAAGALISNRYLYLLGGINLSEKLKTIERYDISKGQWEEIGTTGFVLTETSFASDGREIYLIGGVDKNEQKTNEFIRYRPYLD